MAYDDVLNEIDGYINGRVIGMKGSGGQAGGDEPKQGFFSSLLSTVLGNNNKGVPWANQDFIKQMEDVLGGIQ